LKDGRVLPNNIVDVSKFMDSMIDVNLMDECANELAQRFLELKPSKVLTVATTGLVAAIPMSKYLQIPCVYARKQRTIVMASCYHANYSSKTVGQNRELLVAKDHIDPEDRILIVDDFLSSGSSQEALLRIISDAGATAVGIAVLIEKQYDKGRKSLSGYNVKVESLVAIKNVNERTITVATDDDMNKDVVDAQ
jgi:xanthine phosphoribosyltransferase